MLSRRGKHCKSNPCGPNLKTPATLFNTLVTCKTRTEDSRNSFGEIEPTWAQSWQQLGAVHPVTGREFLRGGQITGEVNYLVRVASSSDTRGTSPKSVIQFDQDGTTRTLEVVWVIDLENAGIEVELGCKEIV